MNNLARRAWILGAAVLSLAPGPAQALDCSGAAALTCNTVFLGTTVGGPSSATTYPCGGTQAYNGPERVYSFTNPVAQTVSFVLGNAAADLDVALIDNGPTGGCAEAECLDLGEQRVIAYDLAPGNYYVVVDGKNGASGNFDLAVICGTLAQPPFVNATLDPNNADTTDDCVHEDKTLWINPTVYQADVLFTIDTTGSQQPAIDNLKTWSRQIIARLNQTIDDVHFGLVNYRDYNGAYNSCGYSQTYGTTGDFPYLLELPMTNDLAALDAAINSLTIGNGIDAPESITRAFYETYADANIGFRAGSAKIVINLTDVGPHDCDYSRCNGLYPVNQGTDPGRDAVIGTADDLEFLPVLNEMAARRFFLFNILTRAPDAFSAAYLNLWGCWTGVTGGVNFDSNPSLDTIAVADTIVDIVRNQILSCDVLTMDESTGFDGWMRNLTPPERLAIDLSGTFPFSLDLCPPAGSLPGTYDFTVNVLCDGIKLAEQRVSIEIPSAGPTCSPTADGEVSPTSTCAGETVTLTATGSSVPDCGGTVEYRWRGSNGFLRDWSTSATATDQPVSDTTYNVDVRCVNPGCQASSPSMSVAVGPVPAANAGIPTEICVGDTDVIGGAPTGTGGTPPFTYSWTAAPPDPSMSCTSGSSCTNPTVSPADTTTYTVRVTDSRGCFADSTTLVSVIVPGPPPDVTNTLRVIREYNDVLMSWSAPNANEVAYRVRRDTVKQFTSSTEVITFDATFGTTVRILGDVSPVNTRVFYRVTTLNCAGEESPI